MNLGFREKPFIFYFISLHVARLFSTHIFWFCDLKKCLNKQISLMWKAGPLDRSSFRTLSSQRSDTASLSGLQNDPGRRILAHSRDAEGVSMRFRSLSNQKEMNLARPQGLWGPFTAAPPHPHRPAVCLLTASHLLNLQLLPPLGHHTTAGAAVGRAGPTSRTLTQGQGGSSFTPEP